VLPAFAFVGNLIHVRYGRWGLLATGTAFTLIHQIFAPYWLLWPNTIDTFPYVPAFLFGVVAAIIKLNDTSSWMSNRGIFFGNGILIGILISTPLMRYFILGMPPSGYLINKYLFISLAWTVFIYSQINSKSLLQSLLVSRPMTRLGMYSYSIYLIHWLILNKLASSFPEQATTFVAIIFLSILVGFLMYTYIEKPLLSARKYIQTEFNLKPNKTATNE
jgi:peptidoglycan/LPS O-acetylase OafA/YrhL